MNVKTTYETEDGRTFSTKKEAKKNIKFINKMKRKIDLKDPVVKMAIIVLRLTNSTFENIRYSKEKLSEFIKTMNKIKHILSVYYPNSNPRKYKYLVITTEISKIYDQYCVDDIYPYKKKQYINGVITNIMNQDRMRLHLYKLKDKYFWIRRNIEIKDFELMK